MDWGLFCRFAWSLLTFCHSPEGLLFSLSFSVADGAGVGWAGFVGCVAGGARVCAGGVEVLGATAGTAGFGGPAAAAARLAQVKGLAGAAG